MKVAKGHVKSNKGSLNGYELKSGNVSNNKRKVQNKKRKVHTEKICCVTKQIKDTLRVKTGNTETAITKLGETSEKNIFKSSQNKLMRQKKKMKLKKLKEKKKMMNRDQEENECSSVNSDPSNIVALDCEFVGVGHKGKNSALGVFNYDILKKYPQLSLNFKISYLITTWQSGKNKINF